jgi:lipooligosaccharide transport system permease protein
VATPLFFFSGSFFPIDVLPPAVQTIAWIGPLTPGVHLARGAAAGVFDGTHLACAAYQIALCAGFFPLAVVLLRRRLVR